MTPVERLEAAIKELEELRDGMTEGPFFVDDCEGELMVYPERLLRDVQRDADGWINLWRSPGSWGTDEMVMRHDLESWDEGEDEQDDRLRGAARMFVVLHRTIDAQLAILRHVLTHYRGDLGISTNRHVVALADAILGGDD